MAGTTQHTAAALPAVEAATLSAAFVTALRRAGLSCSPDRAVRLAEALRLVPPSDVEPLYWASRVVLVSAREQLPVFDAVFAAVFRGGFDPSAPAPQRRGTAASPPAVPEEPRTRPSPAEDRAPGRAPAHPPARRRRLPPPDRTAPGTATPRSGKPCWPWPPPRSGCTGCPSPS